MTDFGKTSPPLATDAQRAAERSALRIVASAAVRSAMDAVRKELLQDAVAATPDGMAGLDRAISLWAFSLTLREVVGDVTRPAFVWPIDANSSEGLHGLLLVFALGPAIAHAMSAWLIRGFPLDEAQPSRIRRELARRDRDATVDVLPASLREPLVFGDLLDIGGK